MKKILLSVLITLLVVTCGYLVYEKLNQDKSLGNWFSNEKTLVGTSSNAVSVPNVAVFADNTTTGDFVHDGAKLITQLVETEDKDVVLLNIAAVSPNASSTIYIRQMGSHDGTNYFDLGTSTELVLASSAPTAIATTTLTNSPRSVQWKPGVATSSLSRSFSTYGYEKTRFIFWSEGWTGDLDTGVQAWITAVTVENKY